MVFRHIARQRDRVAIRTETCSVPGLNNLGYTPHPGLISIDRAKGFTIFPTAEPREQKSFVANETNLTRHTRRDYRNTLQNLDRNATTGFS